MLADLTIPLIFSIELISLLGAMQIWLWLLDRSMVVLGIWGTAHLLAAVGLGLLLARGHIPLRISIDVANAMVIGTFAIVWLGARRLDHLPTPSFAVLLGPALWLLACQFPWIYDSISHRVMVATGILTAYDGLTMREFLRKRDGVIVPLRLGLAIIFGAHAILQLLRIVVATTVGLGNKPASVLPESSWFGIAAMAGIALAAGASMLLIAVAKEEAEQRSIASIAKARDIADQANAAKSRFLARMSHELRTPLNGVLGMAQALTRDPTIRGEQRERAVLLEQAGRHLLAIVNDLLDVARVESGKFELSPEPTRVNELLQGAVDMVTETAVTRAVQLRVELAQDLPVTVLADPLRVSQILLNLLGNAIKFTPAEGRVTLSVSRLQSAGGLSMSVTDTGPGVPSEIIPYLFQDFAQRPVGDETSQGTGLGLAISTSLAQKMGGTIRYRHAANGTGSVFTVDLPLPDAAGPVAREDGRSKAPSFQQSLTVLVVDDVQANRKLAEILLRQAGYNVRLAANAAEAEAVLASEPTPHVVLMDIYMPEIDGLTATRRIRAMPGAAGRVPVIALTADASTDRAEACHAAGMNGFITKPLDFAELVAAIAAVLPGAAAQPIADRSRQALVS